MTTAPPNPPAIQPQRVITLVHGTWAHNAAWARPESKLCRNLSQIDPPPILRSFQWSGRNSHHARLQAADALARQLAATCTDFPNADHHVIAHSHGGNVALHALRAPSIRDRVTSVVCLATPFIHASKRPLEPGFLALRLVIQALCLAPASALAIFALFFALIATQVDPDSSYGLLLQRMGVPWPLVFAGLSGGAAALLWGGFRLARKTNASLVARFHPALERYQRRLSDEYDNGATLPLPVLNVQVAHDEPGLWLRLLQRMSETHGDARAAAGLATVLALMLTIALAWNILHDPEATESFFSLAFFVLFTVAATLLIWLGLLLFYFVVAHAAFMLVPFIFRGHGLGFGDWSLFSNWLMLIQARPEPPPGHRVDSLRVRAQGKGLRHSRVYDDDRVITHIAQWLTQTSRDSTQHTPRRERTNPPATRRP